MLVQTYLCACLAVLSPPPLILHRWYAVVGSYLSVTFIVNALTPLVSGVGSIAWQALSIKIVGPSAVTQVGRTLQLSAANTSQGALHCGEGVSMLLLFRAFRHMQEADLLSGFLM